MLINNIFSFFQKKKYCPKCGSRMVKIKGSSKPSFLSFYHKLYQCPNCKSILFSK